MNFKIMILLTLILLTACAERWSETGKGGIPLEKAEAACRAKAEESARNQLPFPYDRQSGPAGFPPDSRRDIIERETALCLKNSGFTLRRSWR